jgi:predicted dehydrogenase
MQIDQKKGSKLTRRAFSGLAAATTASAMAAVAAPAVSYARIVGANAQIRLAVIGLNSRGKDHIAGFGDHVVALCDCDSDVLGKVASGTNRATFSDYRKLCESPDIDAVAIATPNHTHSLIGVTAMAAGKHVYVEKPVSHNVREGRLLSRAAERFQRICQCGTQSRSSKALRDAVAFVQQEKLGKVQYAIGTCYKPRKSIGRLGKPLEIAKSIDYDLWCGPAEMRPIFRPNLHYDWHWDFNTGNGDMGNQGIHQMDIARWFLGHGQISPRVLSIGGRVGYEDAGDTPNTQTVIHDYPDAPIIFETRGLPRSKEFQEGDLWGKNMDEFRGSRVGVIVQCENGYVVIPDYSSARAFHPDGTEIMAWQAGGDHYGNFIGALQNQDAAILNAPVVEGHISSALCHTGNLSHRNGRRVDEQEMLSAVQGEHPVFRESVDRMLSHLKANGVNTSGQPGLVLGAALQFDPSTETVNGNDVANAGMSRVCRPGFEIDRFLH